MSQPIADAGEPATALILVDVTNSFFLEGMPNHYPEAATVLEPLRRLLSQARASRRIRYGSPARFVALEHRKGALGPRAGGR